jgi:hypothetical protein
MPDPNPVTWVCETCGSERVSVGAYATWNVVKQEWDYELEDNSSNDFCFDCFSEVVAEKPVTDLKILAQIAINREQNRQKEETNDKCNAEHTDDAGYAAPC